MARSHGIRQVRGLLRHFLSELQLPVHGMGESVNPYPIQQDPAGGTDYKDDSVSVYCVLGT